MNNKKKNKSKNNTIIYKGKVNISIMKDGKTVSKSNFHNTGMQPLFDFLARCVVGNYNEAENLRPKFIKLYSIGEKSASWDPSDFNFVDYATDEHLRSLTNIIYNSTPNLKTDNEGNVNVTFKFLVPFSQLSDYTNLNMLALYSQQYKDNNARASAYIVASEEVTPGDYRLLDIVEESLGVEDQNENNYNLFIEWIMTFKNE